ncbi:MAG TPA: rhomboid family intramembrane serine protease [Anaerolineaceae bacterium]|jgi:rhomboid protease GluP|nr:rhomboid family intramembrane serine protease [Anaerolineaceae bacterium]
MTNPDPTVGQSPRRPVPVFWHKPARIPWVSYVLIGINVMVYLIQVVAKVTLQADPLKETGALVEAQVLGGEVWRLITYAFLHCSLIHVGINMYSLYILRWRELDYGHGRYLSLYLVSALGGSVAWLLVSSQSTLGAAAPLFGIIGAEITLLLKNRPLFANPGKHLTSILLTIAINLFLALTLKLNMFSILGGLLTGMVYGLFAGPVWRGAFEPSGLHIIDQQAPGRSLMVSGVLALIFCLIILAKMVL